MTFALAITAGLCYFIGTCRVGSATYNSFGSGVWIGFVCGLVYGDVLTGLILGASIQLVFLGVIAPGGTIPNDEIMAGSVAIPIALVGGLSAEMAISIAVPFGLLGAFIDQIRRTSNIYFTHKADDYAAKGDRMGIYRCGIWYPLIVCFIIRFIPVFLLQYFGSQYVYAILDVLPAWLTGGLTIAGGILPAIGFAIIIKTIDKRELLPWFFIGFFLIQYLGVGTMAAAIFGACIAILTFIKDMKGREIVNNG